MRNTWLLYLTSTQAKWSYFELSWVELGLRLGFDNIRAPWVCVAKQLFSESLVEGGGGGGGHRPPLTRTCVTFSQFRLDTGKKCNITPGNFVCQYPGLTWQKEREGTLSLF